MITPIDLHVHSLKSDGSLTPTQLVDLAIEKGLSAFALTDHDSIDGLDEAISYAKDKPVEVIPGIEFSTEYEGRDIHIVGLYIDYKCDAFQKQIQNFVDSRVNRNKKMCARLREEGIDITYEALVSEYPDAVLTRSHYAGYLFRHGYVKSRPEAFDRYIGDHAPCFVPREKVTPIQAIQLIRKVGGIPIMAHPILYHMSDKKLEEVTKSFAENGLMGIEAIYSTYSTSEERQMRELAAKYNLLISGGSDFHGQAKPGLELGTGYGKLYVPSTYLDEMKKHLPHILFTDLDGTLLRDDCTISSGMRQGLKEFCERGNYLVLSSGRPLDSILSVKEHIGLNQKGTFIIASNGAVVFNCDTKENVVEHRINAKTIARIEEIAASLSIHIHGYSEHEIVSKRQSEELTYYQQKIHLTSHIADSIHATLFNGSPKLLAIHLTDHELLETFKAKVLDEFADSLELIFSNPRYLEIYTKDSGKGAGVRSVCEFLHIPINRAYAAGDAENDISMITAAGHGIAMQNALQCVKDVATIITSKDNNEDGLLDIIQNI